MPLTTLQRKATLGYFSAFVMLGATTAVLGPTLTDLADNTGATLAQVSVLFTAKSAGYLVGSLLGGWLYDRIQPHRVMPLALLGMALTLGLSPLIPILWLLAACLLLLGLAEGSVDVGGNALLVWTHGSQVGPYMNALHAFFGIGTFLAPIIIAQSILHSNSINAGYWLLAALLLPIALWVWLAPSPAAPQQKPTAKQEVATGRARVTLIFLVAAFLFLYVGAEIGFGSWIATFVLRQNLADKAGASYLTSAFWGAFTFGRLVGIPLAARLRPRLLIGGELSGCLLSLGLILIWPETLAAIWIGALGLGFSMASIFPTTITLAERRMTLTGSTTSWFFVGGSLGSMFLPWMIGQFFERSGPVTMLWAILADLLVAVVLFNILIRVSQPKAQFVDRS